MANPMKGEVEVTLGDNTYKTRLTVDSLIKIEEETGKGIVILAQRMAEADIKLSDISTILRYALRGGGNDFDNKKIYQIISEVGIIEATKVVANLITDTLSDPNQEKKQQAVV